MSKYYITCAKINTYIHIHTSMKKRINLVVVGFGVVFAIFSTGLIIYGWFHPHTLEEPCRKLLDSIIS